MRRRQNQWCSERGSEAEEDVHKETNAPQNISTQEEGTRQENNETMNRSLQEKTITEHRNNFTAALLGSSGNAHSNGDNKADKDAASLRKGNTKIGLKEAK